jgi:hypothetical protein
MSFQALYGYEPLAREMVLIEATQVAAVEEWMQKRLNMDQLIRGLLEGAGNRMKQVVYVMTQLFKAKIDGIFFSSCFGMFFIISFFKFIIAFCSLTRHNLRRIT